MPLKLQIDRLRPMRVELQARTSADLSERDVAVTEATVLFSDYARRSTETTGRLIWLFRRTSPASVPSAY